MKNLTFGLFIITIISVASCGAISSKGTTFSGSISDGPNMRVYFDKIGINNNVVVLGQADTDANGDFTIKLEETVQPAIYRFRIGQDKMFLVLEDSPTNLMLKGTLEKIRTSEMTVTGSESAKNFMDAMNLLSTGRITANDAVDYINNTPYPMAGLQLAMSAFGNRPEFVNIHKSALALLTKKYPTHEYVAEYTAFITSLEQSAMQVQQSDAIQVGMVAPEITLKNPEGKTYSLTDLKGKVVLLDFWASWCGPCRRSNPHVVELYNKYKDKGFTVFSVSLDGIDNRSKSRYPTEEEFQAGLKQSKKNWTDAIEKDQLTWPYHVSELTKWDTQSARLYGVSGIPKTFLINREGKIVAVNPHETLEQELLKVL